MFKWHNVDLPNRLSRSAGNEDVGDVKKPERQQSGIKEFAGQVKGPGGGTMPAYNKREEDEDEISCDRCLPPYD